MDKCRYNNNIIYIFDFYDNQEEISNDHVELLKKASKEGNLNCDYCGEKLRFNYGKIVKPYFSHINDHGKRNCKILKESISQKKVKRIFYEKILKDNLGIYGEINYRFKNGLFTDLYFKFKDGYRLAIDYIDDINKLNRSEKSIFLNENKIDYIKIIDTKLNLFKELQGDAENGYLYSFVDYDYKKIIMLDYDNKQLVLFDKNIRTESQIYNEIYFEKLNLAQVRFNEITNLQSNIKKNKILVNENIKREHDLLQHNSKMKKQHCKEEINKSEKNAYQISMF